MLSQVLEKALVLLDADCSGDLADQADDAAATQHRTPSLDIGGQR
jgi:hypothetical protein